MENVNIESVMEHIRAEAAEKTRRDNDIDVDMILQTVRDDISARGLRDNELLFESIVVMDGGDAGFYSEGGYCEILEAINQYSDVQSYRPLFGNPVERFIKKVIRRMVAFYIESIVDDQNRFNKNVYGAMVMNLNKFREDQAKIKFLEKRLYECEKRIIDLERQGDKSL